MALDGLQDEWLTKTDVDADFTVAGSPPTFIDDWGNTNYGPPDGITDALLYTAGGYFTLGNTSGITRMVMSCWFRTPISATLPGLLMTQRGSSAAATEEYISLFINSGGAGQAQMWKGSGANRRRTAPTETYEDNTFHHFAGVWDFALADADVLKSYIDGVKLGGGTSNEKGTGSTDWPSAFARTFKFFSNDRTSPEFSDSDSIRQKIWFPTGAISDADILAERNTELAAQPAGGNVSVIYSYLFG